MSVCLNHCLKRFPLVPFTRYYPSAVVSRSAEVSSAAELPADIEGKKRPSRRKTPKSVSKPDAAQPPVRPSILEWTSVQAHLRDLAETNGKIVLADIERSHDVLYRKQLRQFLKLYDIALPAQRKEDCALAIMEKQWNWPSLALIQAHEQEAKEDVKTIPLNPSQAFLILGKDGANFRYLSHKYHVRMTYSANPLRLRVEGVLGAINQLAKHIAALKEAMGEEVFELPIDKPIREDILHRISRLSGALTENFGQGKVRVSFDKRSPQTAVVAKRLATRASLHWTVSASGVFRVRRVEEWSGAGATEDSVKTGGLSMGRGRLVTLQQQEIDLRVILLSDYPKSSSVSRLVSATTGHVLLTSPPGDGVTIAPPLHGHWQMPVILQWMDSYLETRVFTQSLPFALFNSQPSRQQILHRLIYHAIDTGKAQDNIGPLKMIKVELVLPRDMSHNSPGPSEGSELMRPVSDSKCCSTVRQSMEEALSPEPSSVQVVSESALDLEGDQKSTSSQVFLDL
ncbi:hypothetical protein B0H10DRAFT_1954142 [Mycena sp. CBHHK59/15]|nr:hypothetical protein B0H10DRAFT_1954142 [Mycena sp. CBHHK59/15]